MDLIWVGTDVLLMNEYPKGARYRYRLKIFVFRILVKILDRYYINRNWVVAEHLGKELKLKKPIMDIEIPRSSPKYQHLQKYTKVKHEGFRVLYYFPKGKSMKFKRWLYGWDIYFKVRHHFGDKVTWIIVDGSSNMAMVYPRIDFLLRCNRHDGMPMMVRECEINEIPYYWSKENPDIFEIIKSIEGSMKC